MLDRSAWDSGPEQWTAASRGQGERRPLLSTWRTKQRPLLEGWELVMVDGVLSTWPNTSTPPRAREQWTMALGGCRLIVLRLQPGGKCSGLEAGWKASELKGSLGGGKRGGGGLGQWDGETK